VNSNRREDGTTEIPVEQWAVPKALRGEVGTNVEYSFNRKDTGVTWFASYSFALRETKPEIGIKTNC
jgi:hypothetical protein